MSAPGVNIKVVGEGPSNVVVSVPNVAQKVIEEKITQIVPKIKTPKIVTPKIVAPKIVVPKIPEIKIPQILPPNLNTPNWPFPNNFGPYFYGQNLIPNSFLN